MYKSTSVFLLSGLLLLITTNAPAQTVVPELPGPLTNAHAPLEADCRACHSPESAEPQSPLCLNCHSQIKADLSEQAGFHGKSANVSLAGCFECHAEHKGRDAKLINFDSTSFSHEFTDFQLIGEHRQLDCDNCHNLEHVRSEYATAKPPLKYRYVQNNCFSCHGEDQPHEGKFGDDCAGCHSPEGWGKLSFDHGLSRFPLIGVHQELDCDSCHSQAPGSAGVRTCRDCHLADDGHEQRLSLNCGRCHSPNGWDRWQFDHLQQTGFQLQGAHQELECVACHKTPVTTQFQISPACAECHRKDDQHRGDFGFNCDRCHQPTSFKDLHITN